MKQRYTLFAMFIALMIATFAVSPQSALAANYSVATANDLITAITSANVDPAADTIILTVNVTLTSAVETDAAYGTSGLPAITSDITIEGQGHSIIRSAAVNTPNFRILRVATGAHLTLYNLTISGGKAVTGSVCNVACGGGLFNEGLVTAIHAAFSNNSAENGGAFYNNSTSATITDSIFLSNSASNRGGGVLVNTGTVTINDSVFSANIGGDGAGIYSVADVLINHTTFSGNRASLRGGGIMGEGGNVKVDGSTFSNNYAEFSGGAGIALSPVKMSITNSTFTRNIAAQYEGGALFVDSYGTFLSNDTFSNNSAAFKGGSIYIYDYVHAAIENIIVAQSIPENCFVGLNFTSQIWPSSNLSDDATCAGFTHVKSLVPPRPLNLGTLADNGGSTKTLAVNSPSPALDNASAACFNPLTSGGGGGVDQRGFTRGINAVGAVNFPQVGDCDTGAFEAGGVVRTLQFMFPSSNIANGSNMPINIPLKLNSVLAQVQAVNGYVWVSGGTAIAGQDYVPFGVQAVTITPGMTTANATITPLNPSATSDKTIILSFATQHGPGFRGAVRLGTQLTHIITLKANGAPNRNYYTTNMPTLTWNRVSQAFRYEIQVSDNALFVDAMLYDAGNNLSFVWPVALPNGSYYWRVRACIGAVEPSCEAWSAPDTFTVFVP